MPMPIAHGAAAVAIYLAFRPRIASAPGVHHGVPDGKSWWLAPTACLFLAVMPDLDFIPGLLRGQPNLYHQGLSHSLFVLAGCSLLVFVGLKALGRGIAAHFSRSRLLFCLLAASLSHPVLDLFSLDTSTPVGVPLFWPVSSEHFSAGWPIFLNVQRADLPGAAFFLSLFSLHNLLAGLREAVFGLAVILLAPLPTSASGAESDSGCGAPWLARGCGLILLAGLFLFPARIS
jgi:membrane-bound metal-dependent hydrolase YbcI (DUF457 family)